MDNKNSYDNLITLSEFMHEIVMGDNRKDGFKVKPFAEFIRKGYSTVYGELNKFDKNYKLGADMILPYMQYSDDIRPLEWLAYKLGYSISKLNIEPDRETWQAEQVQDMSAVGEMARMMDNNEDPYEVFLQSEKAISEIRETAKKYLQNYNEQIHKEK